jgi:anti-anti-sigma factor
MGQQHGFDLEVARERDHIVFRLAGELDAAAAEELWAALRSALASPAIGIDLDLARLTFIDSGGVAAVLWGYLSGRDSGVGVRVVRASRSIARTFDLMGLGYVLERDRDALPGPVATV